MKNDACGYLLYSAFLFVFPGELLGAYFHYQASRINKERKQSACKKISRDHIK